MPVFEPLIVLRLSAASSLTVGSCSWFVVGLALRPTPGSCPITRAAARGQQRGGGASPKLPSPWTLAALSLRWSDSDKPAPALSAGSYTLTSVLPAAPDMAQFKQGVRSVAGKLSVFANGVMTSIQVSEMGTTVTEFDGGFVVLKMRFGPLFKLLEN